MSVGLFVCSYSVESLFSIYCLNVPLSLNKWNSKSNHTSLSVNKKLWLYWLHNTVSVLQSSLCSVERSINFFSSNLWRKFWTHLLHVFENTHRRKLFQMVWYSVSIICDGRHSKVYTVSFSQPIKKQSQISNNFVFVNVSLSWPEKQP